MRKIQRVTFLTYLLMIMMISSGCGQKAGPTNFESFFIAFRCYEADTKIYYLKDVSPHEMKMKQKATLNVSYELTVEEPNHLKGTKMTYDGKNISQYHPGTNTTEVSKVGSARNEMILTSFVERFLDSKQVKKGEEQLQEKKTVTFEIPIEGSNKYMIKEKIWLDYETKLPIQMVIYDEQGQVTLQVEYTNFRYNF